MNPKTEGHSPKLSDDWDPFGKPLFDDPSARALSRVGVVDVGSNSVRMVVFDGAARSPAYFYNEKVMAGLGQGLAETGMLNPQGRERAFAALQRFALLADGMGIGPLTCVATAAVREAQDGPEFQRMVERATGLKLHVIDGTEEARLSAQGVLLGWPEAQGLICDIGGNSMELAEIRNGRVWRRVTSPLGPFRLQQVPGGKKELAAHIKDVIAGLAREMGTEHERIYLVGGSWRAIARLDMERRGYPLLVLHEYRMDPEGTLKTLDWIEKNDLNELRSRTGTSSARMELVPLAAMVLRELIATFGPKEIDISSYGIREGLLYEQMPERLRRRDPLIEACRHAERTMARLPGFGKRLHAFIQPIWGQVPPEKYRLMRAACLLHDTTWRTHPDYRAEACFDNVTRANMAALSHPERVFVGLALLHRYKNSRTGSRFEPLFTLLTPEQIQEAEVLGKAMRFGAMFSIHDPQDAGELNYKPKKNLLELRLTKRGAGLYGEVAAARLTALAAALKAEPSVRLP
ncbi:Ppx/GppA family phosphatase [Sedimentimonas flavescens]|uniref:Ppx/GppA family phosphatase n=1 Tax=Sedimentimonas flavescens TaxID=2851012 RepID=A0ABT2ZVX5_9RHOB|nr:Ppx/GppA family phosphatase [Sedimentimonas flavescens]MBW0157439.1 Ppx/GppA family phosphatase [Sedimentimonas flavescens]MCT2538709.1 Ppx/GppA family phosphatase [Sedimentimonas flavescens]MCV2877904.1 Ppx/GppA family phosphatase [Sedimentimonas flavescens]WBL34247.1 Ppx/GppA family phosphatase [Sinirhodobacter sp. HNIBRBA609]